MSLSKKQSKFTVWLLSISILLTPLLTYLVTPMVTKKVDGELIVVCTLEGVKEIYVDSAGSILEQSQGDDYCPALKLFDLVGTGYQTLQSTKPVTVYYQVGLLRQDFKYEYRSIHFPNYASRAPPLNIISV